MAAPTTIYRPFGPRAVSAIDRTPGTVHHRHGKQDRWSFVRPQTLPAQLPPPLIDLLARDIMAPRDLRNPTRRPGSLADNRQLLFDGPPPPALHTRQDLLAHPTPPAC